MVEREPDDEAVISYFLYDRCNSFRTALGETPGYIFGILSATAGVNIFSVDARSLISDLPRVRVLSIYSSMTFDFPELISYNRLCIELQVFNTTFTIVNFSGSRLCNDDVVCPCFNLEIRIPQVLLHWTVCDANIRLSSTISNPFKMRFSVNYGSLKNLQHSGHEKLATIDFGKRSRIVSKRW